MSTNFDALQFIEQQIKNRLILKKFQIYINNLSKDSIYHSSFVISKIKLWIQQLKNNTEFINDICLNYLSDNIFNYNINQDDVFNSLFEFNNNYCKSLNLFTDFLQNIMI